LATIGMANLINRNSVSKGHSLSPIAQDKKWEYLIVWILYLLMYEFYFRTLLFPYHDGNLVSAIAINVCFYVLAHTHHGKEAIGAIPYGIIICLVTASTGNLWAAFLSHLALAFIVQFIGRGLFQKSAKNFIHHHINQQS
jgi:membrane protease YdiL (CAAX protease family)